MNKWAPEQPSPWRKSSKRESCYGDLPEPGQFHTCAPRIHYMREYLSTGQLRFSKEVYESKREKMLIHKILRKQYLLTESSEAPETSASLRENVIQESCIPVPSYYSSAIISSISSISIPRMEYRNVNLGMLGMRECNARMYFQECSPYLRRAPPSPLGRSGMG